MSEEHCTTGEPKICERCYERNADIIVNLQFKEANEVEDNQFFPFLRLCSPCFLILYRGRNDIEMI